LAQVPVRLKPLTERTPLSTPPFALQKLCTLLLLPDRTQRTTMSPSVMMRSTLLSVLLLTAPAAISADEQACASSQQALNEDLLINDEPSMQLLQVAAKDRSDKAKAAVNATAASAVASNTTTNATALANASAGERSAPPAALVVAATDANATSNVTSNKTVSNTTHGKAVMHEGHEIGRVYGSDTCGKFTGGTCLLGGCAESRSSICDPNTYMCLCPDYTCTDDVGACQFSVSEVTAAVSSGVGNVGEQVSALANSIPGLADSMSGISGLAGSAGQVLGEALGLNDGCARTVTSCIFSDCPQSVSNTAECSYGVCSCKEYFCYSTYNGEPYCSVDINSISQAATQTVEEISSWFR